MFTRCASWGNSITWRERSCRRNICLDVDTRLSDVRFRCGARACGIESTPSAVGFAIGETEHERSGRLAESNPRLGGPDSSQCGPWHAITESPRPCQSATRFSGLLLRSAQKRFTPIQVTLQGVIFDGHHAVRAAAEEGSLVEVFVVDQKVLPSAPSIFSLSVR